MFKKSVLIGLSIVLCLILIGCGKNNKLKVVSDKKIEEGPGTKEVQEKILKSDSSIKYEFETENYNVVVTTKYNGKNFTYKDGKFESKYYSIYMEYEENDYNKYDLYKNLEGHEDLTIDGLEAIRISGDVGDTIMVKINEESILHISGDNGGKMMTIEMIEDKYYKEFVNNIKIKVTKK